MTADRAFYEEIVAIAKAHDIILLSDLAYSEIYFGEAPPSIFEFIDPEAVSYTHLTLPTIYSV